MYIKFWGSRGSISTPEKDKLKYGGNTTCVELIFNSKKHYIIDAGTGIKNLGASLVKKENLNINILFTHAHWDHLAGFPFFLPIYNSNNNFTITGYSISPDEFKKIISVQMNGIYHPVMFDNIASNIVFKKFQDLEHNANEKIDCIKLSHPGGGYGYKFTEDNKSFVFLTDNELAYDHNQENSFSNFVEFCSGVDVLVHDAQYDNLSYFNSIKWGHSRFEDAFELAVAAKVKKLLFFHHDPSTTDKKLDYHVKEYTKLVKINKLDLKIAAVSEGMLINL